MHLLKELRVMKKRVDERNNENIQRQLDILKEWRIRGLLKKYNLVSVEDLLGKGYMKLRERVDRGGGELRLS